MQLGFSRNITPLSKKKHIPARDPKQCGGSRKIMHIHVDGGDDDDGDDGDVCDDGGGDDDDVDDVDDIDDDGEDDVDDDK